MRLERRQCQASVSETNRRGADMTYSSCWGSWIQAINLVVLLLGSPQSTQRENNHFRSTKLLL